MAKVIQLWRCDYREYVLDAVDSGLLTAEAALAMCLKDMPQDEVRDMLEANEILIEADEA